MCSERFLQFIMSIDRISKNIKRIKDIAMEKYSLRSAHVMCLLSIEMSPDGLGCTEMAEICEVDKAFISRVTTDLESKGFITRNANDNGNMYKSKFILTEEGKEINRFINEQISEIMKHVSGEIPLEKIKVFYDVLSILDDNISFELKDVKYGK